MPKKQALIKRSNGNISITIENNLKADQNAVQQTRRRRKKRTDVAGGGVGGTAQEILRGGGSTTKIGGTQPQPPSQKPYIDVSYIRPPPQSYSIWNDTTVADPNNIGVGYSQAQQMGLISKQPQAPAREPTRITNPIANYPIESGTQTIPEEDELKQNSTWIPIVDDDSQKSRYVEKETPEEEPDYEPRYTKKETRTYIGSPLDRYPLEGNSRYADEEPAWMRTSDSPDEDYSTDSDFEAAAKRLFPKPKRGRPTKAAQEEKKKKLEIKEGFQNMLLAGPKTNKKLSDEEIKELTDQEMFNEGVKYAQGRANYVISDEEFANAETPFLQGMNSVLPLSQDEEVIFGSRFQEKIKGTPKPRRERKPVDRFKPR